MQANFALNRARRLLPWLARNWGTGVFIAAMIALLEMTTLGWYPVAGQPPPPRSIVEEVSRLTSNARGGTIMGLESVVAKYVPVGTQVGVATSYLREQGFERMVAPALKASIRKDGLTPSSQLHSFRRFMGWGLFQWEVRVGLRTEGDVVTQIAYANAVYRAI